ncbi:hypothetical protein F5X98DRAFT_101964 [Xylaria grammica]|nr:hypothetical protein F5X98DRAFT_101964 [Xylaria grammica]
MAHFNPTVQEDFIPALRREGIAPVHGFKDFVGDSKVLLDDGTVLGIDVVIFCTGHDLGFKTMPEPETDGTLVFPLRTAEKVSQHDAGEQATGGQYQHQHQPRLPQLYEMIFPARYTSSVARLGYLVPQENIWCLGARINGFCLALPPDLQENECVTGYISHVVVNSMVETAVAASWVCIGVFTLSVFGQVS